MPRKLQARESVGLFLSASLVDAAGAPVDMTGWAIALSLKRKFAAQNDVELGLAATAADDGFYFLDAPRGAYQLGITADTLQAVGDQTGDFVLFGDIIATLPNGDRRLIEEIALRVLAAGSVAPVSPAPTLGALSLSASSVAEDAAVGTIVGAILAQTPGSTLSLVDDAGGLFALDGGNLEVAAALDYETAISHNVTVRETRTVATNSPRDTVLAISVSDVDDTAPTITSSSTPSVAENAQLAHSLTANETVTWSIAGGADAAKFEISGSTLRWTGDGAKNYEAPDDADANNVYIVTVRATDTASNTTDQVISVTVTNVAEGLVYVGGKTATRGGTLDPLTVSLTDLTGGIASAPAAGDIVIVSVCIATLTGGDMNMSSQGVDTAGYTTVADLYSNDSTATNFSVHRKIMGGTPDTSFNIGGSGWTARGTAVAVHVWRGVDQTTPMDVAATTATGGNTGIPNPPAITPVTAGAVILVAGGGAGGGGTSLFGAAELSNFRSTEGAGDTYESVIGMGSKAWTGGAFDPATFTGGYSGSTLSWAAATLALRPA